MFPVASRALARKGALWTPEEDLRLIELRRAGAAVPAIARELGRTAATVYTRLRQKGVVLQAHRGWTQAEVDAALAALRAGATFAQAAADIGRTEVTLRSRLAYDGTRVERPARAKTAAAQRFVRDAAALDEAGLRAAVAEAAQTLREIAVRFGAPYALVSRLAREIHGGRYVSAAARAASARTLAQGRAAKAARPSQASVWTPQAIAALAAAVAAPGWTLETLAAQFGSTPRMVDQTLRDNGLRDKKRARRGLSPDKARRVAELAAGGVALTLAARELGCDPRTLRAFADAQGFAFGPASRVSQQPKAPARAAPAVTASRKSLAAQANRLLRAGKAEARRAQVEARAETRAQAKARKALAKEQAARVAEANRKADRLAAMAAPARVRPAKAKPVFAAPPNLAAMVAAHIACKGVTRPAMDEEASLIAAIRARGYAVTRQDDVFRIDNMSIAADDLAAFALKRGIAAAA